MWGQISFRRTLYQFWSLHRSRLNTFHKHNLTRNGLHLQAHLGCFDWPKQEVVAFILRCEDSFHIDYVEIIEFECTYSLLVQYNSRPDRQGQVTTMPYVSEISVLGLYASDVHQQVQEQNWVFWYRFLILLDTVFTCQVSDRVIVMFAGPSELISPAYSWRSASFTALIYSLAVHYYGFYTPKEGLAILTFLFVLHAFLGDVLKRPLDFTEPLARRFYSLANIPNPSSQTQKSGSNTKKTE